MNRLGAKAATTGNDQSSDAASSVLRRNAMHHFVIRDHHEPKSNTYRARAVLHDRCLAHVSRSGPGQ